uniref:carboxyl-terminal-processing peptidase 3, chloroplastic n=1 Tax=Erigeron canadensis TaxID=72917 RepID=UPI001CB8CA8C|nr:carboxyl-terminal-processing peptidase 3, chloroplastic [Erigeron canadensis]
MNTLCSRPNLDLNGKLCPISLAYTQKPTSILCYKYRFCCSKCCDSNSKYKVSLVKGQALASKEKGNLQVHGNEEEKVEVKNNDKKLVRSIAKALIGMAAAVSLCLDSPALAESMTIAFPASRTHEVNAVQRTLVETWGLIRETFVDPTFNHQDWDSKFQQTMVEMLPLRTADAAYSKIRGMLSTLGDPFTRIISPKEYQSFRIGSDGNVQGVGLFVNTEPKTGHLIVLSCVEGSPAARAGIHVGDELIEINGERLNGISGEAAAQKLRGHVGTSVTVKVHNGKKLAIDSSFREVRLPREFIRLSPISSAIIPHRTPDGHVSKTGYVKLLAFSQTAAADMKHAIHELENQGVESYILDLRNNPGGLVKAGLDVAQIWLDGDETLVNTIDRDGNMLPINMTNGHALTRDPLVVLVNEGSASASEILAGALHDNGRAKLIGNRTFGKGKIQSVTELHDGSALFITVAKYLSPARHAIDQVGIAPDVQCTTEMLNSSKDSGLMRKKNASSSSLEGDSCILVAEHELDTQESKGTAS